jgi:hypothetical protein
MVRPSPAPQCQRGPAAVTGPPGVTRPSRADQATARCSQPSGAPRPPLASWRVRGSGWAAPAAPRDADRRAPALCCCPSVLGAGRSNREPVACVDAEARQLLVIGRQSPFRVANETGRFFRRICLLQRWVAIEPAGCAMLAPPAEVTSHDPEPRPQAGQHRPSPCRSPRNYAPPSASPRPVVTCRCAQRAIPRPQRPGS